MPRPREPCESEQPGMFYSGVPGVLATMKDGRIVPGAVVELCDFSQRYSRRFSPDLEEIDT